MSLEYREVWLLRKGAGLALTSFIVPKIQKLCGLSIQIRREKSREKLLEHKVMIHRYGETSSSAEAKQASLQLQLTFLLWLQATVSDAITECIIHILGTVWPKLHSCWRDLLPHSSCRRCCRFIWWPGGMRQDEPRVGREGIYVG